MFLFYTIYIDVVCFMLVVLLICFVVGDYLFDVPDFAVCAFGIFINADCIVVCCVAFGSDCLVFNGVGAVVVFVVVFFVGVVYVVASVFFIFMML